MIPCDHWGGGVGRHAMNNNKYLSHNLGQVKQYVSLECFRLDILYYEKIFYRIIIYV